jgi:hypothetical protein
MPTYIVGILPDTDAQHADTGQKRGYILIFDVLKQSVKIGERKHWRVLLQFAEQSTPILSYNASYTEQSQDGWTILTRVNGSTSQQKISLRQIGGLSVTKTL